MGSNDHRNHKMKFLIFSSENIFIIAILKTIYSLRIVWTLLYIRFSKKTNEILLFKSNTPIDTRQYILFDFFEAKYKVWYLYLPAKVRRLFLKWSYIRVEEKTQTPALSIDVERNADQDKSFYVGYYFNKLSQENLLLYKINERNEMTVFLSANNKKQDVSYYFHSFYHVLINQMDKVEYHVPDRIKDLLDTENSMLIDQLEDDLVIQNKNLYFSKVGEFLQSYPVENFIKRVIEHRQLIIDFCDKNNLVFCYSAEYMYSKKSRNYAEVFNSISPKFGFVKKEFFNEWKSQKSFSDLGLSDDGIFHKYKVSGDNPKKDGYLINYIFIDQVLEPRL